MSEQKVDVLAVLDSLIEYHDTSDSLKGRNCIAARAAVAELIAKAQAMLERIEFEGKEREFDYQFSELSTALARVGGEA